MPTYVDALPRSSWDKHGERVSILDYMTATGNVADAINAAIQSVSDDRGGASIQIPSGTFIIDKPIRVNKPNIVFHGEGENSIIKRGADMPDNEAIFVVTASNVLFRDFQVDGDVTVSTGISYATVPPSSNPLLTVLTKNSSFRIQTESGGTGLQKIKFERVTIRHTGGYAILFDATQQYITTVRIIDCRFENNRPHKFGPPGNLTYGAWTGGVLCEGNGTNAAVHDLLISGCSFFRCNGNCFWTHLYAFTRMHSDIRVVNNDFLDIGRDGIMMGGITGGVVQGNTLRRIGYIHSSDVDIAVPMWLNDPTYGGQWAVGIDTSGLTIGVNYVNNTLTSCNGGYFDLDGFSSGTIVGNKCRTPAPGDTEYGDDQIGTAGWGGRTGASDWAYGINAGNTSQTEAGGKGITIVGNQFQNMGRGAIDLYACRDSYVADNDIYAVAQPSAPPISLGNVPGTYGRTVNVAIMRNKFHYAPAVPAPCIFEYSYLQAYLDTDYNTVSGNTVFTSTGYAYEFERSPDSASNALRKYSSRFAQKTPTVVLLTSESSHAVQREGHSGDSSSVLRWYNVEGAATPQTQLHMQLQAYSRVGYRSPLLNVSRVGETYTGAITTGDRTAVGIDDVMATGILAAQEFLALSDFRFTDARANVFDSHVGLIRYVDNNKLNPVPPVPNKFQFSTESLNGVRVWQDFSAAGGGLPIGGSLDTQILFNKLEVIQGSPSLRWDYVASIMVVIGALQAGGAPKSALTVNTGYIESQYGFLATQPQGAGAAGNSQNYNCIQAPGGGMLSAGFEVTPFLHPGLAAWVGGYISIKTLEYANFPNTLPGATFVYSGPGSSAGQQTPLLWASATNATVVPVTPSPIGIMTNTFINAAIGFVTLALNWNCIQAPDGGIFAKTVHSTNYTNLGTLQVEPSQFNMSVGDKIDPGCMFFHYIPGANPPDTVTMRTLKVYDGAAWQAVMIGDAAGFVTIATTQTITGAKTFAENVVVGSAVTPKNITSWGNVEADVLVVRRRLGTDTEAGVELRILDNPYIAVWKAGYAPGGVASLFNVSYGTTANYVMYMLQNGNLLLGNRPLNECVGDYTQNTLQVKGNGITLGWGTAVTGFPGLPQGQYLSQIMMKGYATNYSITLNPANAPGVHFLYNAFIDNQGIGQVRFLTGGIGATRLYQAEQAFLFQVSTTNGAAGDPVAWKNAIAIGINGDVSIPSFSVQGAVMVEGDQTVNGYKTFSLPVKAAGLYCTRQNLTSEGGEIILEGSPASNPAVYIDRITDSVRFFTLAATSDQIFQFQNFGGSGIANLHVQGQVYGVLSLSTSGGLYVGNAGYVENYLEMHDLYLQREATVGIYFNPRPDPGITSVGASWRTSSTYAGPLIFKNQDGNDRFGFAQYGLLNIVNAENGPGALVDFGLMVNRGISIGTAAGVNTDYSSLYTGFHRFNGGPGLQRATLDLVEYGSKGRVASIQFHNPFYSEMAMYLAQDTSPSTYKLRVCSANQNNCTFSIRNATNTLDAVVMRSDGFMIATANIECDVLIVNHRSTATQGAGMVLRKEAVTYGTWTAGATAAFSVQNQGGAFPFIVFQNGHVSCGSSADAGQTFYVNGNGKFQTDLTADILNATSAIKMNNVMMINNAGQFVGTFAGAVNTSANVSGGSISVFGTVCIDSSAVIVRTVQTTGEVYGGSFGITYGLGNPNNRLGHSGTWSFNTSVGFVTLRFLNGLLVTH